jgi:hypothetical protein
MKEMMVTMLSFKTKKQEQATYLDVVLKLALVTHRHIARSHRVHLRMLKATETGPVVKNKLPGRL